MIEQYQLDEFFEGYNLSYSISDSLDSSTIFNIYDSVQLQQSSRFSNEIVKKVIDISY